MLLPCAGRLCWLHQALPADPQVGKLSPIPSSAELLRVGQGAIHALSPKKALLPPHLGHEKPTLGHLPVSLRSRSPHAVSCCLVNSSSPTSKAPISVPPVQPLSRQCEHTQGVRGHRVPYPRLRGGRRVMCQLSVKGRSGSRTWSVWERARSLVQTPRDECEHVLSGKAEVLSSCEPGSFT